MTLPVSFSILSMQRDRLGVFCLIAILGGLICHHSLAQLLRVVAVWRLIALPSTSCQYSQFQQVMYIGLQFLLFHSGLILGSVAQEHITNLPAEVLSTPMGQMLAPMLSGVLVFC